MSKTKWKNQYKEIPTASKFHNKVREIFATDNYFKLFKCYQELNVQELIPTYSYNNHHYDWYIEELNLILELHGRQHYVATNFGKKGYDEVIQDFNNSKKRDSLKKMAAIKHGFSYKEISYKYYPKLDAKLLKTIILKE